ncbi:FliH/SctL family protein [Sphingobium sp. B2]|uniref:FliH/SctL family protein n=1 Tax=Sphingobium sp. B2 TaxID=2583228 RepID=UPI001643F92F|nr:FliH/SctL family protein [Sphingobium sp. B2]
MDASFHTRPFTFDRVFPIAEADVPETALDMALRIAALHAELEAVRAGNAAAVSIARAEGFEAGLSSARADRDTALLSAIDALQASLEDIDAVQADALARLGREAALTAVAAADIMAARALELAPAEAIDDAIGRVLLQIARGQEVVISVHPDLVEDVEGRITQRQGKDRRKLNLIVAADPALAMGDARLLWDTGGLELDADARRSAVLAEIAPLIAASAPVVRPVADAFQDDEATRCIADDGDATPDEDDAEKIA